MVYSGETKRKRGCSSMELNNMEVIQSNGLYYIFDINGQLMAIQYLPHNGQLLADFKTLDIITKAIALRWGIIKPKKK